MADLLYRFPEFWVFHTISHQELGIFLSVIAFFLCSAVRFKKDGQCEILGYKITEFGAKAKKIHGHCVLFAEVVGKGKLDVELIHEEFPQEPIPFDQNVLPGPIGCYIAECLLRFHRLGNYWLLLKCDGIEISRYPIQAVFS